MVAPGSLEQKLEKAGQRSNGVSEDAVSKKAIAGSARGRMGAAASSFSQCLASDHGTEEESVVPCKKVRHFILMKLFAEGKFVVAGAKLVRKNEVVETNRKNSCINLLFITVVPSNFVNKTSVFVSKTVTM